MPCIAWVMQSLSRDWPNSAWFQGSVILVPMMRFFSFLGQISDCVEIKTKLTTMWWNRKCGWNIEWSTLYRKYYTSPLTDKTRTTKCPFSPNPLLSIYTEELKWRFHIYISAYIFVTTLFTLVKMWTVYSLNVYGRMNG